MINPHVHNTPTGLPIPEKDINIKPEQIKEKVLQQLVDSMQIFWHEGLSAGVSGHISVADPICENRFWVNPFGIPFNKVKVNDLICADENGKIVDGNYQNDINPSAFAIHSALHKLGHTAIAHSHGKGARSLGGLNSILLPLDQESAAFYLKNQIFGEYNGPAIGTHQGEAVARELNDNTALILKHHGLITVGNTLPEAIYRHISFERCANIQVQMMAAGKLTTMSASQALLAQAGFDESGLNDFSFQMLVEEYAKRRE